MNFSEVRGESDLLVKLQEGEASQVAEVIIKQNT